MKVVKSLIIAFTSVALLAVEALVRPSANNELQTEGALDTEASRALFGKKTEDKVQVVNWPNYCSVFIILPKLNGKTAKQYLESINAKGSIHNRNFKFEYQEAKQSEQKNVYTSPEPCGRTDTKTDVSPTLVTFRGMDVAVYNYKLK